MRFNPVGVAPAQLRLFIESLLAADGRPSKGGEPITSSEGKFVADVVLMKHKVVALDTTFEIPRKETVPEDGAGPGSALQASLERARGASALVASAATAAARLYRRIIPAELTELQVFERYAEATQAWRKLVAEKRRAEIRAAASASGAAPSGGMCAAVKAVREAEAENRVRSEVQRCKLAIARIVRKSEQQRRAAAEQQQQSQRLHVGGHGSAAAQTEGEPEARISVAFVTFHTPVRGCRASLPALCPETHLLVIDLPTREQELLPSSNFSDCAVV